MGMAELSTRSTYVLKPRARPVRWGRIFLFAILLLLALAAAHVLTGFYQDQQLKNQIEWLRRQGEPMLAEDFTARQVAVADEDNAALALYWAAQSMDVWSEAADKLWWVYFELPFSDEEMGVLSAGLEANREPLQRLREAREKRGVNWQVEFNRPLMFFEVGRFEGHADLAGLARADVLVMHQMGRESEALERARDLLMMVRVLSEAGINKSADSAKNRMISAADVIQQIAVDLRIGQSMSEAKPAEVRKLIEELLDEKRPAQMQRLAVRWQRAEAVDLLRCAAEGIPFPDEKKSREDWYFAMGAKPWLLWDARLLLEHWNEAVKLSDESGDAASFQIAAQEGTAAQRQIEEHPKRHLMADFSIKWWRESVLWHWEVAAERRMAALALAIRWYAVEHGGQLPLGLEQLVPEYLPAMPSDPFAGGGRKFGYVANCEGPIIYSVGSNGKDDGGSDQVLRMTLYAGRWDREDAVVPLKRPYREHFPVTSPYRVINGVEMRVR